ncbi:FadR/GntR family transcriptional regulator [Streptomyces albipurpureus]|uniref:GntR family transcriptional regulator n=1 Tax=Streptomyces albipurpureus TaxID=2897419 RepID=A0ABT0V071_9ACTN|nr:GntR family transcriptional regulator [Streptomyces sp. CWNU-1]MCM2393725.1 GntR family transcriptional regulator [Streptomyces sp. CWNU-1]
MTPARAAAPADAPGFRPARQSRLYQDVAGQLREAILGGQYRPGDRLPTEPELMTTFGVSRAVARQATMNLEHEGLVEVQVGSGGGAFVAEPAADAVHQALENHLRHSGVTVTDYLAAKRALEPALASAVLTGAGPGDLHRLRRNVEASFTAHRDGAPDTELLRLSLAFHEIIATATGNPVLEALFTALVRMGGQVPAFNSASARHDWPQLFEEHRQQVAALADRDADRLTALLLAHLRSVDAIYTH